MIKRVILLLLASLLSISLGAQEEHRFFDEQNVVLFSSVIAVRTLDLHSTWRLRSLGKREIILNNSFVDDKPAFAAFSYGIVGGNIAISYWFHKKGWHRSERILSYIHIGSVGYVAGMNYRF